MAGITFPPGSNQTPRYQDTGQGASGRIASWDAWTADPSPLSGPEATTIFRMDDNGWRSYTGEPVPIYLRDDFGTLILDDAGNPIVVGENPPFPVLALGTGGCGTWAPFLDGFSNGATSGGDNAFHTSGEATPDLDGVLTNVNGVLHITGGNWPASSAGLLPGALWNDADVVTVILPIVESPIDAIYFGQATASQLLLRGGNNLPLGSLGTALFEIWVTPGTGVLRVAAEASVAIFISVDTPDWGTVPGDPLTISGTYTGGTPTGFQYALDGGSFVDAPSPTIDFGVWSFVITAPASGVHFIAVTVA